MFGWLSPPDVSTDVSTSFTASPFVSGVSPMPYATGSASGQLDDAGDSTLAFHGVAHSFSFPATVGFWISQSVDFSIQTGRFG